MMNDKVLHAPIDPKTATQVLDIGCGTGIVTHLMSSAFPKASCIGLDLSATPQLRPRPANLRFFQGNICTQRPTQWSADDGGSPLPHDETLFDYVFSRLLILGMSDWPAFIRKEFRLLKPGGWAKVHDLAWDWYDQNNNIVSDQWSWLRWAREGLETRKSMDLDCGKKAAAWMQEAGFVDVQAYRYMYPFCGSSESSAEMRRFGQFNAAAIPAVLETAIPRAMGISDPEANEAMRAEMVETLRLGNQRYQIFHVTVGRKPGHKLST
jgi:ubiquinone/menaquinone biosynthesis C-methylase UbiE